ncbi:MAG: hybrid sensor histidine kinase/response regulator [Archangium sp.]
MSTVFLVDDEESERKVLRRLLRDEGYRLVDCASGEEALELARADPPDLVLLDVRLPGANGFEIARALKAQAAENYLPVILVTGMADPRSRLEGLDTQADEVLTKPFNGRELLARMRNLLLLRSQQVSLLRKNVELAELHRFKDEMSSLVVHDLKNPLSAIITNLRFVLGEPGNLDADQLDALSDALSASQRATRLIQNLLDVTRIEASRFEPRRARTRLASMVGEALRHRALIARSRGITLSASLPEDLEAEVDGDLLSRAIENILDNGMRYTPSGGRLLVEGGVVGGDVELRIGNSGPAIPPAARAVIFEKFGQASPGSGRMNLGLGLYFCRLALEAHGGRIWLGDAPGLPTVFHLAFPLAPPPKPTSTALRAEE